MINLPCVPDILSTRKPSRKMPPASSASSIFYEVAAKLLMLFESRIPRGITKWSIFVADSCLKKLHPLLLQFGGGRIRRNSTGAGSKPAPKCGLTFHFRPQT